MNKRIVVALGLLLLVLLAWGSPDKTWAPSVFAGQKAVLMIPPAGTSPSVLGAASSKIEGVNGLWSITDQHTVQALLAAGWQIVPSPTPTPISNVTKTGTIEIVHEDIGSTERNLYYLNTSAPEHIPLDVQGEELTGLLTGDSVTVVGYLRQPAGLENDQTILFASSINGTSPKGRPKPSPTPTPGVPVPSTFGTQNVLVILVNFQDDAIQPYTAASANTVVFTTATNFFAENSYNQTSLTGVVKGWYTMPLSVASCNLANIASAAQTAAVNDGVVLANYNRYVYAFPQDNACGFGGASNVGGNPSQSWINGIDIATGTISTHIIDHELGHAFGLWHAHSLDCGTCCTICTTGTVVEYGDPLDTMGAPQSASPDYNAFQKERLGWIGYNVSPTVTTVSASGSYTIAEFETGAGPNAIKVLKSTSQTTGAKTYYYLENRQAIGSDSYISTNFGSGWSESGVVFHLGTNTDNNSSDLLNMVPVNSLNSGWLGFPLAVGKSFTDSTAGLTFTVNSADATNANISITVSSTGCSHTGKC
jgi:M6 family metalloprotease-like protein